MKRIILMILSLFGAGALGVAVIPSNDGHIYLVKWERVIEDRGPLGVEEYWKVDLENKKGALVDLRTDVEASMKSGDSGYAIVVYENEKNIVDSEYLGTRLTGNLDQADKDKLEFIYGLRINTVEELVFERLKQTKPKIETSKIKIGSRIFTNENIWENFKNSFTAYAAIGSDTVAEDDFDRGNSADLGSDWTHDTGNAEILSNEAMEDDEANSRELWANFSATSANYEVQATYRQVSGGGVSDGYLKCRYTDSSNHYELRISTFDQAVKIRKNVGGSTTELDSFTGGYSENIDYVLRFLCDGTSFEGYVDGISRVSATDSAFSDILETGLRFTLGNSSGVTFDDFKVLGSLAAPEGTIQSKKGQVTQIKKGQSLKLKL